MKDRRVTVFHKSLEELVESLDATLRVSSWDPAEAPPLPLENSASQLMARLGAADRLASGVFNGNPRDAVRVSALTDAMRRLETAYLAYVKAAGSGRDKAREELSATLNQVRTEVVETE